MSEERFAEMVGDAIVSLPQDMKAVLRIAEDPELDDGSRLLATGALLHVLSGSNAIPGTHGVLAYVDDVLVLRLAVERIEKNNGEVIARHRESSPEFFDSFDDSLQTCRAYLGDLVVVLDKAVDGVTQITHQGYSAKGCSQGDEGMTWLYDAVHEAIVEQLEFDEDEVSREVRSVSGILPHLRNHVV